MAYLSLKEAIQGMQNSDGGIHIGKVVSVSPLQIKVLNDENFKITEKMISIPEHLTDHEVKISISTEMHGVSHLLSRKSITVHNALKSGDMVLLASYNHKTNFIAIGRL